MLDYVPYIKKDAIRELSEKVRLAALSAEALRIPVHAFLRIVLDPKEIRIRQTARYLSSEILTGQLTREEALARVAKPELDEETMRGNSNMWRPSSADGRRVRGNFKGAQDFQGLQDTCSSSPSGRTYSICWGSIPDFSMITIINYGLGNVRAFANLYRRLNIPVAIAAQCARPRRRKQAHRARRRARSITPWSCSTALACSEALDDMVLRKFVPVHRRLASACR